MTPEVKKLDYSILQSNKTNIIKERSNQPLISALPSLPEIQREKKILNLINNKSTKDIIELKRRVQSGQPKSNNNLNLNNLFNYSKYIKI